MQDCVLVERECRIRVVPYQNILFLNHIWSNCSPYSFWRFRAGLEAHRTRRWSNLYEITILEYKWEFYIHPRDFTLDNSEKNNDDKEEKCNIKHDTINFVIITIWFPDFVTDTTTGSYAFVQMKNETLKEDNVVLISLFFFIITNIQ